jgi:hypothetical protein
MRNGGREQKTTIPGIRNTAIFTIRGSYLAYNLPLAIFLAEGSSCFMRILAPGAKEKARNLPDLRSSFLPFTCAQQVISYRILTAVFISTSVADPDPHRFTLGIRIRIQEGQNDPQK